LTALRGHRVWAGNFAGEQQPLMTIRRMKTYAGGQGYVYQYYFVGKRAAVAEASATEYVFDVTSDRKTRFSLASSFLKKA